MLLSFSACYTSGKHVRDWKFSVHIAEFWIPLLWLRHSIQIFSNHNRESYFLLWSKLNCQTIITSWNIRFVHRSTFFHEGRSTFSKKVEKKYRPPPKRSSHDPKDRPKGRESSLRDPSNEDPYYYDSLVLAHGARESSEAFLGSKECAR